MPESTKPSLAEHEEEATPPINGDPLTDKLLIEETKREIAINRKIVAETRTLIEATRKKIEKPIDYGPLTPLK